MKSYRIIAIGPLSDLKKKMFTGQSVMFDGTVDFLRMTGNKIDVVDIMPSSLNSGILNRCLDYVKIILVFLYKCISRKHDVAYITSSLGKTGVYRDILMIYILKLLSVKVVIHQFGADISGIETLKGRVRKAFDKQLRYVSLILIEGEYIKSLFNRIPEAEGKLVIVPNGLPNEGAQARIVKSFNSTESFNLFYLSNLIYSKGWFDVLQAVDILVNEYHINVRCVFAGRFTDSTDDIEPGISNKKKFDDFVNEHMLNCCVEYHIGLYGEEKDKYFGDSNVFLLPTYYVNEGQPVSIIEAMAYGCVPIVTCYRHIPMMVNENNGLFVEPKSPKDIAEKVAYLISNPDIYKEKSRKCIEDYKNKFTFEVFAQKVTNSIISVLS